MKRRANYLLLTIPALALALAGCSLFVSNTRQVKRYVSLFSNCIADKQWQKASAYMTKDIVYYNLQGQAFAKGQTSAKQFFGKIDYFKHTQFYTTILDIKETSESTVWVRAKLQSRKADAVSTENKFWEVSMIWVKVEDKWFLREIKDLTDVTAARS